MPGNIWHIDFLDTLSLKNCPTRGEFLASLLIKHLKYVSCTCNIVKKITVNNYPTKYRISPDIYRPTKPDGKGTILLDERTKFCIPKEFR